MKLKVLTFVTLFICAGSLSTRAQDYDENNNPNIFKLNVTALAFKNYSVQYERVVSRKTSFALGVKLMPSTSLPFKNLIINTVGNNDPDLIKTIESLRLSHFAITPEFRFYLSSKGYGRGVYLAPFYRYATFKTSRLPLTYENGFNTENTLNMSGSLTSHTGGLMLGAQWNLGSRFSLDWWIVGPHFGAGKGIFEGIADKPLTPYEQNYLRNELENLDFPLIEKTVNVTSQGATMALKGPWAGVRAGISIGIRY